MAKVYYEWVVELVDEHGDIHDTAAWDSAMDALDWMLYAQKSIDEGFYQGMAITKKFHLDMAITYNLDDECEGLIDQAHAYVVEGKVPQHFDNGRKIPKKLMNEYAKAVQKVLTKPIGAAPGNRGK